MRRRRPRLAKLTRPRLHDAVARTRLFELLDELREGPIIWVWGPPGSGKTTLVASYIEQAKIPAIWLQLDGADSDPATFFYYLARAVAEIASSRVRPLRLLTPEYLPDLEGYGRRFFRDMFTQAGPGSVVVIDNYHEIGPDSVLHRALNGALSEVPQPSNVVMISRTPPPSVFSRLQVCELLTTLGWESLRLSEAETAAIVARRHSLDPHAAALLHVQAGGWVAGLRLLLEGIEPGAPIRPDRREGVEGVFDYFAAEILDRVPEHLAQVLLKTAFLPRFTGALAIAIAGDEHAGQRIEELYRLRLFVTRRAGAEVTYQYHDLFRAFLVSRAERRFSTGELAALRERAAALLLGADLCEDAFDLFIQAQAWSRAQQIFLNNARGMIAQGRWQTLRDWAARFPGEHMAAHPWLLYWLGKSNTLVDAAQARSLQQHAYQCFSERGDAIGQLLACAAVLEALHFETLGFKPRELWLQRLRGLLQAQAGTLCLDDDLWVHAIFMSSCTHCSPADAMLSSAVDRVKELLPRCTNLNLKVTVANMLHYSGGTLLDTEAITIATREARPLLKSPELTADGVAMYYIAEGLSHAGFGRYAQALECFRQADAVIDEYSLAARIAFAGVWRGLCERRLGAPEAAQATIARSEKARAREDIFASFMLDHLKALLAFDRGDVLRAIEIGLGALARCDQSGLVISMTQSRLETAYILLAAGRDEQARALLDVLNSRWEIVRSSHYAGAAALLKAWVVLRMDGEDRCVTLVRKAMEFARDERDRIRVRRFPRALEAVVPVALAYGIEPEVAELLIRECKLRPPPTLPESWDWRVRIYTLGRFVVVVNGNPLTFGRKAPKRTITLLKLLISSEGRRVREEALLDMLWPDLEGDAASKALSAALHRLRRLLDANEAIRHLDSMIWLNQEHCFVDAWSFEAGVEHSAAQAAALQLYRGSFLPNDTEAPWNLSMRERLRNKFVRTVQAIGHQLEEAGRHDHAIDLYLRGIEADDLVEPLYQGLMRSYQALGRRPEAASVYRRLRQTLSVTLGMQPCQESKRLFAELHLQ